MNGENHEANKKLEGVVRYHANTRSGERKKYLYIRRIYITGFLMTFGFDATNDKFERYVHAFILRRSIVKTWIS